MLATWSMLKATIAYEEPNMASVCPAGIDDEMIEHQDVVPVRVMATSFIQV